MELNEIKTGIAAMQNSIDQMIQEVTTQAAAQARTVNDILIVANGLMTPTQMNKLEDALKLMNQATERMKGATAR